MDKALVKSWSDVRGHLVLSRRLGWRLPEASSSPKDHGTPDRVTLLVTHQNVSLTNDLSVAFQDESKTASLMFPETSGDADHDLGW